MQGEPYGSPFFVPITLNRDMAEWFNGKLVCGARTRAKSFCKLPPLPGKERCHRHINKRQRKFKFAKGLDNGQQIS